jgi:hypothetical protein
MLRLTGVFNSLGIALFFEIVRGEARITAQLKMTGIFHDD